MLGVHRPNVSLATMVVFLQGLASSGEVHGENGEKIHSQGKKGAAVVHSGTGIQQNVKNAWFQWFLNFSWLRCDEHPSRKSPEKTIDKTQELMNQDSLVTVSTHVKGLSILNHDFTFLALESSSAGQCLVSVLALDVHV